MKVKIPPKRSKNACFHVNSPCRPGELDPHPNPPPQDFPPRSQISKGISGNRRSPRPSNFQRNFRRSIPGPIHPSTVAAAAASRCLSRCELLRAAGPCPRAGLLRRDKAAGSSSPLPAGRGRAGWLESCGGDCIHLIFLRCLHRRCERQQGSAGEYRCVGGKSERPLWAVAKLAGLAGVAAWKHVQKISRPSPPCPRNPFPRLLLIRSASEAANLSLHRDPPQVQLDRRLRWVACALCRRRVAAECASWPCCGGAALQLAGCGAD